MKTLLETLRPQALANCSAPSSRDSSGWWFCFHNQYPTGFKIPSIKVDNNICDLRIAKLSQVLMVVSFCYIWFQFLVISCTIFILACQIGEGFVHLSGNANPYTDGYFLSSTDWSVSWFLSSCTCFSTPVSLVHPWVPPDEHYLGSLSQMLRMSP